jgi:acyl-CoA-binding protein
MSESKYVNENFLKSLEIFKDIKEKITSEQELELYGYYQQANYGNNITTLPSAFNLEARAKWYSWKAK